jgi:hypothetical protein
MNLTGFGVGNNGWDYIYLQHGRKEAQLDIYLVEPVNERNLYLKLMKMDTLW